MSLKDLQTISAEGQSSRSGRPFPQVFVPEKGRGAIYLQEYFAQNRETILDTLSEEGALFFRNFGIQSPNEMSSILNKLGLESFEYIGGAAVRKLIVGSNTRKSSSV